MTTTAPLKPSGYVEDSVYWSAALAAFGEQVPDLMWPTSNWTYSQMRRDPQLAGILKAYTLPLRRSSWAIDPTGCRPEVAALVADDMGLRIKGDDEPGSARVRGVSWGDHLRAALLSLTYGHMGFEVLAEVRNSQYRLVSLSERMPYTIGQIRINADGGLAGVDQLPLPGDDVPQLSGDQLLWYVHEREGAAWQGNSLLRPAFAPWLFKREMQRVLATSNRRFGMGVPVMRALPGTDPTQAQGQVAAQMAQSIRVGEEGGAAVPPGYILELIGLSGSVPDTQGFIDWLNQEMSRSALTGFMDLGNTPNGSRALGQSFIDLFLLAIQAVADEIADTATRQIAARLVRWNFGEDEPVPQVVVGDVGASHQVTAEAISALVRFGAIQPDPALDQFLRREYKIPDRTTPYTEPLPPAAPVQPHSSHASAPAATPAPPRPKRARHRVAAAAAPLRREPTPAETTSGANFSDMQQQWQDARDDVQSQWPDLVAPAVAALALLAGKAVAAGLIADLGTLAVADTVVAPISAAVAAAMLTLANQAADDVVTEAASQGVTIPAGVVDSDLIDDAAEAAVQVIISGYANGAARKAMLLAGPDATEAAIAAAVTESLDALSASGDTGWVSTSVASALSVAQHAGRMATLEVAEPQPTYTASEVLDQYICAECLKIDGTVFADRADAFHAYPTGRYRSCLGADRCRGTVIGLWVAVPTAPKPKPKTIEPVTPEPATPDPAAPAIPPAEPTLADHIASGVTAAHQLGGGMSARTELVTFADGSHAVRKTVLNDDVRDPVDTQDAEELSAKFAATLGVDAPEVVRTAPNEVYLAYVADGVTGMERYGVISNNTDVDALAATDAGRRLGLFDVAQGNVDRNGGNWIVDDSGNLTAIDHGLAWMVDEPGYDALQITTGPNNVFAFHLANADYGSRNYSAADVEHVRTTLNGIEAEFTRLNRGDWLTAALARLDALAASATGDGSLF